MNPHSARTVPAQSNRTVGDRAVCGPPTGVGRTLAGREVGTMRAAHSEAEYRLDFFVPGKPAPQGSKRHVGRGILLESSTEVGPWRERIALAAHNYARNTTGIPLPFSGLPLSVSLDFVMPRPTSAPKRSTPAAIKRPDIDKLARAVLDGLTNVLLTDDSAVVDLRTHKRLAEINETPGVHITITTEGAR